ncbi:TlpA family protein disulfide reductase [Emticicia fluvialis]|uniref:TlpA family protein disulfide reductase n=1 Tax=Emticicia fluvialis TaxID=2974474 RepID=UPI002165C553|nr:TlpA disulfide reductase family protein [Emticicia fluvialis]
MKTIFTLLLYVFTLFVSYAQKTTISGKLPSMKGAIVQISRPTNQFIKTPQGFVTETAVSPTGSFSLKADFLNKEIVVLSIEDTTGSDRMLFEQYLYISKGDNLLISENTNKAITITGVGAKHNQLKNIPIYYRYGWVKEDTLPDRIYKVVNNFYNRDRRTLDSLIKLYKPAPDFIEAWNYHLKYARVYAFYNTYGGIRIAWREPIARNKEKWENTLAQLQNEVPLSDDKALVAPSYHYYLDTYLDRKHSSFLDEYFRKRTEFCKEWFDGNQAMADSVMKQDFYNYLKYKMINRYFDGKTKEQMYALLFNDMIRRENFDNVQLGWADFKTQFPNSRLNSYFTGPVSNALNKAKNELSDKMVFLEGIKTWKNITTLLTGKTVLIDMWGTWCGPCREEISANSAELKKHFKNKDVTFLYIANYDEEVEKWKRLIAYYNLEGVHVMASEDLTEEAMKKLRGTGFPTYAIIDKYGKIETSKAGFPMNRDILIKQVEEALNR